MPPDTELDYCNGLISSDVGAVEHLHQQLDTLLFTDHIYTHRHSHIHTVTVTAEFVVHLLQSAQAEGALHSQDDHSPDNVKLPDYALTVRSTRHVKCYSYRACTSVTVSDAGRNAAVHDPKPYIYYLTQNRLLLNTCMYTNMQLTINSFRQLFPDKIFSLTIP